MVENRDWFERELHPLRRSGFKRLLVVGSESGIPVGSYQLEIELGPVLRKRAGSLKAADTESARKETVTAVAYPGFRPIGRGLWCGPELADFRSAARVAKPSGREVWSQATQTVLKAQTAFLR